MANERLRDALMTSAMTTATVAERIGVDAKTVERWVTQGRTPYARHRGALAVLVGRSESYLWPSAVPPDRQVSVATSEIVAAYPHRSAVPAELWDELLRDAVDRIDVLVHAGQFLIERPAFVRTLAEKAATGVTIRINFGDPDSDEVELRSTEEGLGPGVLAARIRYGLKEYRPLLGTPGIEFRFHTTTLYNSIFRFDDHAVVNTHVYGVAGAHAPALHLRRIGAGDLFDTYAHSFVDVWSRSMAARW